MEKKKFIVLIEPIIKSKMPSILAKNKRSVPTLKTIEVALKIELKEGECPEKFILDNIKLWPDTKQGFYQRFKPINVERLNKENSIETSPLIMNFQYPGVWWLDVAVNAPGYNVETKQRQLTGLEGNGWSEEKPEEKNICRNPISAHDLYILQQIIWLKWGVIITFWALFFSILADIILKIVN